MSSSKDGVRALTKDEILGVLIEFIRAEIADDLKIFDSSISLAAHAAGIEKAEAEGRTYAMYSSLLDTINRFFTISTLLDPVTKESQNWEEFRELHKLAATGIERFFDYRRKRANAEHLAQAAVADH